MKTIGMYMALAGIFSIGFQFMDRELSILRWIDMWGDTVGWIIRVGLIVVGGALYALIPKEDEPAEEAKTEVKTKTDV